jgi:hypothetical protein
MVLQIFDRYIISLAVLFAISLISPIFFGSLGFTSKQIAYGLEFYDENEKPSGISYDDLVAKFWNWDIGQNNDQATPKPNGCLINKVDSMVMLMNTANVVSPPPQVCKISPDDGIMIPLWIGWCDTGSNGRTSTDEQLLKCAGEQNLGFIKSDIKVDGVSVGKLDVTRSLISGSLNYKINVPLGNIIDFSSTKGFALTIPADTHFPKQQPGRWRADSQGYWIFLRQLPTGEHTIYYNVRVTPTGPVTSPGTNPHFADITYKIQVQK